METKNVSKLKCPTSGPKGKCRGILVYSLINKKKDIWAINCTECDFYEEFKRLQF